jgi:hypothetical protein
MLRTEHICRAFRPLAPVTKRHALNRTRVACLETRTTVSFGHVHHDGGHGELLGGRERHLPGFLDLENPEYKHWVTTGEARLRR